MRNRIVFEITLCLLLAYPFTSASAQTAPPTGGSYYDIHINEPVVMPGLSGYYSIGLDNVQNKGQNATSLNQYLNISLRGIGDPRLSFYGFGRINTAIHDDTSFGDIYLGYLEYRTFQDVTNIMLGRFAQVTNRFMTIDGISVSQILPWYFGVSAYIGMPRYKEAETADEELRNLGDLSYGGKIFLSGITSLQANASYYKETGRGEDGKNTVFRETLGGGILYYKTLDAKDNASITADTHIEHDLYNGVLARFSGKVTGQYSRIQSVIFADYYDIRDQFPSDRQFVIRLISTGLETRYGADLYLEVADWLDIYGGLTYTYVTMRGGEENPGRIYTLGADCLFDTQGIRAAAEGYRYESAISDAIGVMGTVQWYMTTDMLLEVTGEAAWLQNTNNDNNAVSLECRYTLYLLYNLTTSVYAQKGSKNRFVDDYRWGMVIKYDF